MTDHPSEPPRDDPVDQGDDDLDRALEEQARTRREQRFWHREAREARAAIRAAERGDLPEAELMTRHMAGELKKELLGTDSFVPVFFLAVVVVIVTPLIEGSHLGRISALILLVLTLLMALQRSLVRRRNLRRISWIMAITVAAAVIAAVFNSQGEPRPGLSAFISAAFIFVIAITLPAVLIRTLLHPVVNLNTLAGVMAAYLFIGLLFTGVFKFIDQVDSDAFFAQKDVPQTGDFEYFSFITITTTGYGDLTPGTQAARTAAMAEAITGQIFLVTVVARVVGLLGQQRKVTSVIDTRTTQRPTGAAPPDDPPAAPAAPADDPS